MPVKQDTKEYQSGFYEVFAYLQVLKHEVGELKTEKEIPQYLREELWLN